ncbi:hypothetical protein L218DRAFT_962538 [Marasmius fiardii PR-910]|nr:hypothetical protein L218DRAFT_962538 [Marasmius fiardii PR-910]
MDSTLNPSQFSSSGISAPSKGTAHPKLRIITHDPLRDCPPCAGFVQHISFDAGFDAPWFCEAHRILADSFRQEPQKTIDALNVRIGQLNDHVAQLEGRVTEHQRRATTLQQRVTKLEAQLAAAKHAGNVKIAGTKRKTDSSDRTVTENSPPAKRASTAAADASIIVPHIGFHLVDAEARLNPAIDLTLIEYSNFMPGNALHEAKFDWNLNDRSIIPPSHIGSLLKSNCIPWVRPITGPTAGAQMFPMNNSELQTLVTFAHTNGGWSLLIRIRLSRCFASLLDYLHSRAPESVAALSGVAKDMLSVDIDPVWARHTSFIDPTQFVRDDDTFEAWGQTPTDIPSVSSAPRDNLTDIEFAYGVMVHYNPSSHLGLMVSDSCSFYMPSIIGLHMYLKLAPVTTESDKNFGDTIFCYRKLFVTVTATNGLYSTVIAYKNLTINPHLNLHHCTKADVQNIFSLCSRLASMGVTVAIMDSLYPWALQYCIDVCSRPIQFKAPIRRHYAEIFINAQHRLMFYPLPTPPDATYGAPDHWKADHITEYRRRRAVVRYWKDITDPKYSKDKEIPATRHNPLPDNDAAVDGVAGMTLDGPPPQSSDGDVPIPGPSDA